MKIKNTTAGVQYQFRRNPVLSAEFTEFLRFCGPSSLNFFQLRSLFGCVSLEFANAVTTK